MKVILYGTDLCPDCVEAQQRLHDAGIEYDYRSFATDLHALMEFLAIRDDIEHDALFTPVRERGGIGIPYLPEQAREGKPSMELDTVVEALTAMIGEMG